MNGFFLLIRWLITCIKIISWFARKKPFWLNNRLHWRIFLSLFGCLLSLNQRFLNTLFKSSTVTWLVVIGKFAIIFWIYQATSKYIRPIRWNWNSMELSLTIIRNHTTLCTFQFLDSQTQEFLTRLYFQVQTTKQTISIVEP